MKSMETLIKPGIMAKLRNRRGFSLVEMAIVLVIIGIIIGAIIKGQDLITNGQIKKVAAATSSWRNLTLAYLDRNGRFPGDEGRNGIIGDNNGGAATEDTAPLSAVGEIAGIMENTPDNPLILGSSSFWTYIGNTTTTNSGVRNAILVCCSSACTVACTADQVELLKGTDTAIDGLADGGIGQFRAVTLAPVALEPAVPAVTSGRIAATFNGVDIVSAVNTTAGTAGTTWATTHRAAIWLFDKSY